MLERQHPARKINWCEANTSSACQEPNQNCFSPITSGGNFFCKICQSGARQKCGFGEDFLGVPASWSGWHENMVGRGKERGRLRHEKLPGIGQRWGWRAREERWCLCLRLSALGMACGAGTGLAQRRRSWLSPSVSVGISPSKRSCTSRLPCKPHRARSAPRHAAPGVLWLCGSLGTETAGCALTRSPLMPPRGPITIYWVSV